MTAAELTVYILALIGSAACAVSGASAACVKRLDLFGVIFVAAVTGLGGGVLRDIMLSNLPPAMFQDPAFALVCLVTSVAVFLFARFSKTDFVDKMQKLDWVVNLFDAIGLAAFTVLGINTAMANGFENNAFFLVFIGMTTGIGGGVLRDMILNEVPMVFTKHVYAVATIVGAILYVTLFLLFHLPEILAALVAMFTIILLRILAAHFRWNFPRAF